MRRLVLTMVAVLAVGVGGWWWVRSSPGPITPARGVVGASEVAPGGGGAYPGVVERGSVAAWQALPRFPDTVWRESALLNEHRFVNWLMNSRPGGRYLLQYVCLNPGGLYVRVRGAVQGWSKSVSCPGPFVSVQIVAAGDRLNIMVRRLNHRHVEVALQLVALS